MQGGTSAMLITFFNQSLHLLVPFFITTIILVFVDLLFGVEAAKLRYANHEKDAERVRASTALRRTINKIVSYSCWVVLGATLSVAFQQDWIHFAMMAIIIVNELISIIDNYFYCHGKKVTGLWKFVLTLVGKKLDIDTSDIQIEDVDKPRADSDNKENIEK